MQRFNLRKRNLSLYEIIFLNLTDGFYGYVSFWSTLYFSLFPRSDGIIDFCRCIVKI